MSIRYMVLGFEPTTFRMWVSSHNYLTRAPARMFWCLLCFLWLSFFAAVSSFQSATTNSLHFLSAKPVLKRNFSVNLCYASYKAFWLVGNFEQSIGILKKWVYQKFMSNFLNMTKGPILKRFYSVNFMLRYFSSILIGR